MASKAMTMGLTAMAGSMPGIFSMENVVARSGAAGSVLGEGRLMNFRNGSLANSTGVLTAFRLCRNSGVGASRLRKNAVCRATNAGSGRAAACSSAVICSFAPVGHNADFAVSLEVVIFSVSPSPRLAANRATSRSTARFSGCAARIFWSHCCASASAASLPCRSVSCERE